MRPTSKGRDGEGRKGKMIEGKVGRKGRKKLRRGKTCPCAPSYLDFPAFYVKTGARCFIGLASGIFTIEGE